MRQVPEKIIEYLVQFHGSRDWFECHEVLEEYWKERPEEVHGDTLVGLIQVAVGLYHERRGNRDGAVKMLRSSLSKLEPAALAELGLDGELLLTRISDRLRQLEGADGQKEGTSEFHDLDLPFADAELEARCRTMAAGRGWTWKRRSAMDDSELIHRHMRRDRSDVVQARQESLQRRRNRHK
ncbi:DUF309 domain-containing protein [Paenibacillus chartarius]|uniref:DUF309 domain-containing protein n=1 Tax=Paenibacillus chartarius TaxID=747481 RepID=A0ABV6DQ32_9BACL